MRQNEFPEWAQRVKAQYRGSQLRRIGNSIYLYAVSSRRVEGKSYPVVSQTYLGIVTESGLIEAQNFHFRPLETETAILRTLALIPSEIFSDGEWEMVENICLVRNGDTWFFPKLTPSQLAVLRRKHLLSPSGALTV